MHTRAEVRRPDGIPSNDTLKKPMECRYMVFSFLEPRIFVVGGKICFLFGADGMILVAMEARL